MPVACWFCSVHCKVLPSTLVWGINKFLCTPFMQFLTILDYPNALWDNQQCNKFFAYFYISWVFLGCSHSKSKPFQLQNPLLSPLLPKVIQCSGVYKTKAFNLTFWNTSSPTHSPKSCPCRHVWNKLVPKALTKSFFGHAVLAVVNNCPLYPVRHTLLPLLGNRGCCMHIKAFHNAAIYITTF